MELQKKLELSHIAMYLDMVAQVAEIGCVLARDNGQIVYTRNRRCDIWCLRNTVQQNHQSTNAAIGTPYVFTCPQGMEHILLPLTDQEANSYLAILGPLWLQENGVPPSWKSVCGGSDLASTKLELRVVSKAWLEQLMLLLPITFQSTIDPKKLQRHSQWSHLSHSKPAEPPATRDAIVAYPFEIERALLRSITFQNQQEVRSLLNQLYGHILLATGEDFHMIKNRLYELVVVMSRMAIPEESKRQAVCQAEGITLQETQSLQTVDALCVWLTSVTGHLMQHMFQPTGGHQNDVVDRTMEYVQKHYGDKMTLEEVASWLHLSPAHLSRVFKKTAGISFSTHLNQVRIEQSKLLLENEELRLIDIAMMTGFEDQSYFSKVFKKLTGVSPLKYREFIRKQ